MSRAAGILVPVVALGLGAALVCLPCGCGQKAVPDVATVRGKVTFQGEPLADGIIVFSPDPERGASGKPARGDIAADGTYQLSLGGESAIPPGWYRVAIAPSPEIGPASRIDAPRFPIRLGRPDRSNLLREVKAGQENHFEFAVELPPR